MFKLPRLLRLTMASRAIIASTLLLLAFSGLAVAFVPTASASIPTYCYAGPSQNGGTSCTFHCNGGDIIRVYAQVYSGRVNYGLASCSTQGAGCAAGPASSCYGESQSATLISDTGACELYYSFVSSDDYVYCEAVPAGEPLLSQDVSSTTTPMVGGGSVTTPGASTPPVDPVSSPGVGTPSSCPVQSCTSPTTVGPVATPAVPKTCTPAVDLVCVGPAAPVPLLPGTTMGPLCQTLGAACLPGTTILPAGAITTPPAGSVTVVNPMSVPIPVLVPVSSTPAAAVYVNQTIEPVGLPSTGQGPVGPIVVGGDGPLPITLCNTPCSVPYFYGNAQVSVTVVINGESTAIGLTA